MKYFWLVIIGGLLLTLVVAPVRAITCDDPMPTDKQAADYASQLQAFISSCEQRRSSLEAEANTLKTALALLTSKINLTQAQIRSTNAQIEQLEADIGELSQVVAGLNTELDTLSQVFAARVKAAYKQRGDNILLMFFSAGSYTDFQNKLKFLQASQRRDQIIMRELEAARMDFDLQKITKEQKQAEVEKLRVQLESQKQVLGVQQSQKKQLLASTQNDEKKYQQLIAQARAELEAIENIIAGKGTETQVREVSAGENIARIIQGASCNSSGEHLHFIVAQSSVTQNPFNYLKSIDYENCSGSSCNSGDGDAFNPSGSWDWPISAKVKFSQGYGETWAVRNTWVGRIYRFHNGIDVNSPSEEVKAVQAGTLYRGSYTGQSGCALKYVRVDHKDSGLDTYYLHVNYF